MLLFLEPDDRATDTRRKLLAERERRRDCAIKRIFHYTAMKRRTTCYERRRLNRSNSRENTPIPEAFSASVGANP